VRVEKREEQSDTKQEIGEADEKKASLRGRKAAATGKARR